jgi:excisionase family DNA binding protein
MDRLQVADFLGIQPRTVFRWIANEGLPHAKIGGSLRFIRQNVLEWLDAIEKRCTDEAKLNWEEKQQRESRHAQYC